MKGPPGRLLLLFVAVAAGCRPSTPRGGGPAGIFEEATTSLGLPERQERWPDGLYRLPEVSAGGVALFDFDGDGDLDIYLVCHPPPDRRDAPAPNRLFRQGPDGKFEEVPGAAGLADPGYGNGVAVGDIEGDGDLDVYVANLGPDALYVNTGGAFCDATARAGLEESEWSSSAAFLDYDRDGDLDLYVARYVQDDPSRVCRPSLEEPRDYCGPSRYQAVPDLLYRNDGGRFTDVTRAAGIQGARPGFGVVCADFTGDGWVDIYVANDMQPNQLHVNRGDGTFSERALELGAALSGAGRLLAGMGVAAGDADGDGRLDLFVTNLRDQPNTLYLRAPAPEGSSLHGGSLHGGTGIFLDRSGTSGVGAPSLPYTGWGCGFADLDHDGDQDLAWVNGRVARGPLLPGARLGPFWDAYAEPNGLALNAGEGRFVAAGPRAGDFTARAEVTHGLAFGDLDRDGDLDLVTSGLGNVLRVYRNRGPAPGNHWLQVRALTGRRDALGALVAVEAGGRRQVRVVLSAYSFQSVSEPVAHFGLGTSTRLEELEVLWPDGLRERFRPEGVDRLLVLRQGQGESAPRGR